MSSLIVRGARVGPGEGEARWIGGEQLTVKLGAAQSGGAVTIIESLVHPGYGPPPHLHLSESKSLYVVSGTFTVTIGDQELPAPAGATIGVPRGRRHAYRNVGTEAGTLLITFWPAATLETFITELGETLPPAAPPEVHRYREVAGRHGIVVPPDVDSSTA